MLKAFGLFIVLVVLVLQSADAFGLGNMRDTSCTAMKRLRKHITCEGDGSYSTIQCRNGYCSCVNTTTGRKLGRSETFKNGAKNATYCRNLEACGSLQQQRCRVSCRYGYNTNQQGCKMCSCKQLNCNYTKLNNATRGCGSKRCVEREGYCLKCKPSCNMNDTMSPNNITRCQSNEQYVTTGYGWRTCRAKLSANDTCQREESDEENENSDDDDDDDEYGIPAAELLRASSEEEDQMVEEEGKRVRKLFAGASARRVSRKMNKAMKKCQDGYFCEMKGRGDGKGGCQRKNTTGVCTRQRGNSSQECDNNGYFKPRYCKTMNNSSRISCVCVYPTNGTKLTDTNTTFADNGDEEANRERKPKCTSRVYRACRVSRDGRSYVVQHGKHDTNPCTCQKCLCLFGTTYCKTQRNCSSSCDSGMNCTVTNGTSIVHGDSIRMDCNWCRCKYGNLLCTRRNCGNQNGGSGLNSNCTRCRSERVDKVCGPNGKTYINHCTAVYCAGIASVDLIDGSCTKNNPCVRFPCPSGQVCLRRGGVSCLDLSNGCKPDTLRYCINMTDLACSNVTISTTTRDDDTDSDTDGDGIGNGDIDPDDTSVCGDDGNTYASTCHMIQTTNNVQVLHAGRCNSSRCKGGPVCGTDGETYENICELRTQSDNARMDYKGSCVEDENVTASDLCDQVVSSGRCRFNTNNCDCLVRPVIGCCPTCGGAMLALLDKEGLSNASTLDTELETLDGLMGQLGTSEDIFSNVSERCSVEPSLTPGGNLELVITSFTNSSSDRCHCYNVTTNMIAAINRSIGTGGGGGGGRRRRETTDTVSVPSSYQYLLQVSQAEIEAGNTTNGTGGNNNNNNNNNTINGTNPTTASNTTTAPTSSAVTATTAFAAALLMIMVLIAII